MSETIKERKIEILIGLFLLGGIIAWLVIPMSFQDTTIILEGGGGGAPISCLPSGGFVLAQNLTDLCDVTIISPTTNQIIQYNGSQWINVAQTTFNDTTTCNNIGIGSAFVCVEGTNVDLRSLLAGTGIIVNNDTNTITITNSLPEATTGSNLGLQGTAIFSSEVGNDLQFKKLAPFNECIGLGNNSTHVIISNDCVEDTACITPLLGEILCIDDSIDFKNLLAGSSISLSSNTTHITITNTAPDNTVCANVGTGTVIYKDGECNFKTLVGSPDISITNNTNTVVIDYNGTHVTSLTSADTNTLSLSGSTGDITITPKLSKLCQTTASGGETSLTCTLSTNNTKAFMVQISHSGSGGTTATFAIRFNGDSGTNYALRSSTNGGADATSTSQAQLVSVSNTNSQWYHYQFICNEPASNQEKHCYGFRQTSANGAGNADARVELIGKWANTSAFISQVNLVRTAGTSTIDANTVITVWGIVN